MATYREVLEISFVAGADLRNYPFAPVRLDTTGRVILAGANERAIGILQNKPNVGETAVVMLYGISKAVAAGPISIGSPVVAAANGRVSAAGAFHNHGTASSNPPTGQQRILGFALTAATAAGQVIEVLLAPFEF
jgi:murein DD-endopeptidase MepM/ murein hydrolase activator NlpD